MKKLIAGNWKMNGTETRSAALVNGIGAAIAKEASLTQYCDFLICPAAIHITVAKRCIDHDHLPLWIGGQDCAAAENGAYTGDVSAEMLKDAGCSHVILGHSERRVYQQETSACVSEKAGRAHIHGLVTVICVGEQEEDREDGRAFDVVEKQLFESLPDGTNAKNTVIAYEPVWAIGTGKVATPQDVSSMHGFIREKLKEKLADANDLRLLYGGSVKPENAAELFLVENVDGALIGGASLEAEQFVGIARAVK